MRVFRDPSFTNLQATSVTIELEPEAWINTDGEVLSAKRCEYTVLPGAATFLAGDAPFARETRPYPFGSNV